MLLEKLLSTDQKINNTPDSPRPDYEPSWGYKTTSGERVSVEASKAIATAYRAKNVISNHVAIMPFQEFERNGKMIEQVQPDPITRNKAYLLQVSPNLWGWTPFQFMKAFIEWKLFYGNAYIWSPTEGPPQHLILPADKTVPVFDPEGNLWYQHTFSNSSIPKYIPAVEVLHDLINPDSSGFIGRGVIAYARDTFGRRIAANKTQSKLYSQGFLPAAAMTMAGEVNKDARKKLRDEYEEQMSGTENAYRLAILDPKITKYEPINIQMRDQQFLESIGATDVDIANFFDLPLHMLNMGKEAYNSNEQKYIEYLQGTLNAHLVPFEQAARIRWLTEAEKPNRYFKFIRESLLQMDGKSRAEVYQKRIQNGTLTPNEALEKEDMNGYAEGDRHYMMGNVSVIGPNPQVATPTTPSQPPQDPSNQDSGEELSEEG